MTDTLYLRRHEAASYIRSRYGFCTQKSLAKAVVTGGGPRYFKAGKIVLYRPEDLDVWAKGKISPRSFASSAEAA